MESTPGKKKAGLDYLFYVLGKQYSNFWLTFTYLLEGEVRFSKWHTYLEVQGNELLLQKVNQRTSLLNEVVLEYDGSWDGYLQLIRQLKKDDIEFLAYATDGKRAKHIHTIWDARMAHMSIKTRESFRQKLIARYGCDPALAVDRHMIALENCPHWKTGEAKELIDSNGCKEYGE